MTWKFHAFTVVGDGRTVLAVPDVDLSSPTVVRDLSGPGDVSGTISPEISRYKDSSGMPIFLPYKTAIAAEYVPDGATRGRIVACGVLEALDPVGPDLELTAPGALSALLKDTAHAGIFSGIDVDPLDVVRDEIIGHAQSQPHGDLGITVDPLTTSVRIGEEERDVSFETSDGEQVEFTAGPYVLAWYRTDDLQKELDDLASETPFDYVLDTAWSGDELSHHLRLGHPRIGVRRHSLRFMVGENVVQELDQTYAGEDYASEVIVLGAGEGRDMIRGTASKSIGRLRRTRVITDKSITSRKRATAAAEAELKHAVGDVDVDQVVVSMSHPNAPYGSFDVGDDIYVQWPAGWTPAGGMWVRVLSMQFQPDEDTVALTVSRAEKTA